MRKAENRHTSHWEKSKVNETCYCEHVTIKLKCGSGWSGYTERICG